MKIGVASRDPHNVLRAKQAGFEYFQPSIVALSEMTDEEFSEYIKLNQELQDDMFAGVTAGILLVPGGIKLVGSHVDLSELESYLDRVVPRLTALGITDIAWSGAKARMCPEGWLHERAIEQFTEVCKVCVSRLEPLRITLCIEPMGPQLTNTFNGLAEVVELAREIDSPFFGVVVDCGHMHACDDTFEDIRDAGSYVRQWHINDTNGKYPCEDDLPKLREIYAAVKATGYDGLATLESLDEDFEAFEKVALPLIKRILIDIDKGR